MLYEANIHKENEFMKVHLNYTSHLKILHKIFQIKNIKYRF